MANKISSRYYSKCTFYTDYKVAYRENVLMSINGYIIKVPML